MNIFFVLVVAVAGHVPCGVFVSAAVVGPLVPDALAFAWDTVPDMAFMLLVQVTQSVYFFVMQYLVINVRSCDDKIWDCYNT